MAVEFAQIISTLDQRPETTDPVHVFMDQSDAIYGIDHSNDHPDDIRIQESGTYVSLPRHKEVENQVMGQDLHIMFLILLYHTCNDTKFLFINKE